jgi:hypothetical protein
VLTEHSHVERHGKVTHSIIGPNTGIAEGEVTASLIGPFVGFHHQSMLIGALWPEGKGNVAYGANVGSNHTSKAPDQEIYCGEGVFFGLGVNIKFPADYSRAPYSIFSTGITTLPQRVTFPFSLINSPARRYDGVSPAYNELIPAWVLSDNLYTVERNQGKFKKRNKARRSIFVFDVFRPETIDMMLDARMRLKGVSHVKEVYLEGDLPGTGKNFVTRQSLLKAIETYSLHIEYYCLNGLFARCRQLIDADGDSTLAIYTTPTDNLAWEYCRNCLLNEGYATRTISENLDRLNDISEQLTLSIVASKEKDDIRGKAVMDDYADVHTPALEDPFIKDVVHTRQTFMLQIQELKIQLISRK